VVGAGAEGEREREGERGRRSECHGASTAGGGWGGVGRRMEEATKREARGTGCSLARGIGARAARVAAERGREPRARARQEREEAAAREAGRWDCRALF